MWSQIYVAALALSVVTFNSQPASGQSSNARVSATYTLLRDSHLDATFWRGISFDGAYRLHRWLFVAGELALSTYHMDFSARQGGIYDYRYLSFQAGPRVSPMSGRVQPYGEVLVGATYLGFWGRQPVPYSESRPPKFSIHPGFGVDVFVRRRLALRFAGHFPLVSRYDSRSRERYWTKQSRFNAGIAFHFDAQ